MQLHKKLVLRTQSRENKTLRLLGDVAMTEISSSCVSHGKYSGYQLGAIHQIIKEPQMKADGRR